MSTCGLHPCCNHHMYLHRDKISVICRSIHVLMVSCTCICIYYVGLARARPMIISLHVDYPPHFTCTCMSTKSFLTRFISKQEKWE